MTASATEVEDMLKKLQSYDGVVGFIVMNDAGPSVHYPNDNLFKTFLFYNGIFFFIGIFINTTFDNPTSVQYVGLVQQLIDKWNMDIKEVDSNAEVMHLSLCCKKHEIRIFLGKQRMSTDGRLFFYFLR